MTRHSRTEMAIRHLINAKKRGKPLDLDLVIKVAESKRASEALIKELVDEACEQLEIREFITQGRYVGNSLYQVECVSFRTQVFQDCGSHTEIKQCFCDECPIAESGMKGLKKCFGIVTQKDLIAYWEIGKTPEGVALKHKSPVSQYLSKEEEANKLYGFIGDEKERKAFLKTQKTLKKTA